MANSILNKKSVCVITGPTRGLGRSIAYQLSKRLPEESLFILLSRNEALLNNIADVIMQRDGLRVVTAPFDQGAANQHVFDQLFQDCLTRAKADANEFEQAILVNNAGTLEHLMFARDLDDISACTSYFTTNISGCVALTAKFLQTFSPEVVATRVVINISSLGALSPLKSWMLYCMAKAARDMMMKAIGAEEEHIRTLNYAPGPLLTDMTDIACENTQDMDMRNWFEEQVRNKSLVECDASVQKMLTILEKNTFENGAHIDYYDEV